MISVKFKSGEVIRYLHRVTNGLSGATHETKEYATVLSKEEAIAGFASQYGVGAGEAYFEVFGKRGRREGLPTVYIKQHRDGAFSSILEKEVIYPIQRRLPDWW
jgi:hypothetical protein